MKLIGIEEHFATAEVKTEWHSAGLQLTDPSIAFHSGMIEERLLNMAEGRLSLMDETGIDVQVLSLTTPALHDLGPKSVDVARRTNDMLGEVIAHNPTRFEAFATLPVAMPDAAAIELERCVKTLGFKGTILCGKVGSRNLDHPSLAPIFQTAAQLGVPILIHPRVPDAAVREAYYSGFRPDVDAALATYGLGWHYDAGVQFVRLVLSGLFDRLPELQVILGHWGELVLFYAERLAAMNRVSELDHPIDVYLKRNLYVTASGMFLPHFLERARSIVGTERLLFSTDFPYQYRPGCDARRFLDNCGLSEADKMAFASRNWERLTAKVM